MNFNAMRNMRFEKISKRGKAIFIASLFIIIISAGGLYYLVFSPDWNFLDFLKTKENVPPATLVAIDENKVEVCDNCANRWLDGLSVTKEEAESFPVAIMIDNDPLARPQPALAKALLVYEAPVEGGITRYMAIFAADMNISRIGPIRSARPYFVAIADELKALYMHVGGSPEALDLIKTANLYDLNEFYNEKYFWRDYSLPAPHYIFSNKEKWQSYLNSRGLNARQSDAWLFKEEEPKGKLSPDIDIIFSINFKASWRYDSVNNEYLRFFNGQEARDDETQIKAKNLIIQMVDSEVLDNLGRLAISIKGEGKAIACIDGVCQDAYWKKQGSNRTRYYYQNNNEEIRFNPGISWVELADSYTKIVY